MAALLLALVVGPATVVVAATPASANSGKGATVKTTIACGVVRSNMAAEISATYDWEWRTGGTQTWRITNRKSVARTYECTRGAAASISDMRVRTRIRFAGVGITGCTVGTGGVSCSGGSTERNIQLDWYTGKNVSSRTQTLSSASFTALWAHSAENFTDGRFIHGGVDRNIWVSHYCHYDSEKISCSRRT
ncbi:hypothetical protein [Micromonospora sp. WMMD1082]|uniref:hypothetical protein n=1 Tax=Micromonospora sp. WMMD1082 TaxID=3016104 RepID=UPI002417DC7F|nr:hypothetical protein [Micromonospora sp. WMMD1082]MDG4797864.1 hypothetical protein [Micromonospora sp. WMMD1082]